MPSAPGWVYVRRKKNKAGEPGHWPEKKKTETVLAYLTTGSVSKTVLVTGVPKPTIENWRRQPWWQEIAQSLLDEDNAELDAQYTKVLKKALALVEDRMDNGDFKLNQKTGEVIRVPVSLAETNRTLKDIAQQRTDLRKVKTGPTEKSESVNEKLIKLASQFAEMALKKPQVERPVGEVYEGDWSEEKQVAVYEKREEGLQNRVPEVPRNLDAKEESCGTEQCAVNDG